MTIGYDISVENLEPQIKKLTQFDQITKKHLKTAMRSSVLAIQSEITPLVPVGVSARLKNSIGSEIIEEPGSIIGRVGSSLKDELYPQVMEFGRTPGKKMPPVESLIRWVHLKIQPGEEHEYAVAFGIAKKIGKHGIEGRRFMQRGFEAAKPKVVGFFNQALERIANDLAVK